MTKCSKIIIVFLKEKIIIQNKYIYHLNFCFVLIVIGLSSCKVYYNTFYTDPEKYFVQTSTNKPYDVIIVPGFPSDSGKINSILAERLNWAFFLYRNGFTKHLIFSGAAVYTPFIEAKIMRSYALQLGVKPEDIYTETQAEHTTENLYYSCIMAQNLGFKKIGFATQPAQTSFMKPFRRKFKLKVDLIPVLTDSIKQYSIKFNSIDLEEAFVPNFISIEKRENLFQRLNGTRGYRVKIEMRKARKLRNEQAKK